MLKFKVIFTGLLISLQIHSDLSEIITEKDNVELEDISRQFKSVMKRQLQNINLAEGTLKSLVEEPKKSLEVDLQDLRQYIRETNVQAKEEHKNISNCLEEGSLDGISFNQIDVCEQKNLIKYTKEVLRYLSKQYTTIVLDTNPCNQENNSSVNIDNCERSRLCRLKTAIKQADVLITSILETAHDTVFRCLQISMVKISQNITSLARSFTTCTDKIMEYLLM